MRASRHHDQRRRRERLRLARIAVLKKVKAGPSKRTVTLRDRTRMCRIAWHFLMFGCRLAVAHQNARSPEPKI